MMKHRVIPVLLAGCLLLSACGKEAAVQSSGTAAVSDEGYIDSLTPKNDFYGYINAAELMETDLDGKNVVGTLYDLDEDVKDRLNDIIDEIAASDKAYAPGSNEQLIHDLYHKVYDFYENDDAMEEKDTQTIDALMARIDAVSSMEELYDLWADLANHYGIFPVFLCGITENIYDVHETVFNIGCFFPVDLDDMKKSDVRATVYRDGFVARFKRFGMSEDEAKQRANDIMYAFFEIAGHTDLALYTGDKEDVECFRLYTEEEVRAITGDAWFDKIICGLGVPTGSQRHYAIYDDEQLKTTISLMDQEHLQIWKDCTTMSIMDQSDAFLPEKYNMAEQPEASTERLARYYVRSMLEKELAEIYAEKYFDEEKRACIQEMCEEIRDEYYDLIGNADWMTQEGRDILCRKLDTMQFYIGCGEAHVVDPKDADLIGDTMLETFYNFNQRDIEWARDIFINGAEEDPFDTMSASTVNACYVPLGNYVIITAAILTEPVFDVNADRAVNLGAIGSCIGHEISHAFDDNGVNYDEKGNYNPGRMPEADIQAFKERQEKAIEYYNGFTVLSSHVSGKKTLGENLADISGVQCVLAIADGPEEQKEVLESYARYWKTLMLDTTAKDQLSHDVHAPSRVRVNAVVSCFDEYYEIYDVAPGDPMYVAPEDRVRRW